MSVIQTSQLDIVFITATDMPKPDQETNEKRKSLNHIQFGEAAAEMKKLAKSESGSLFLVDQREVNKGVKKNGKVINMNKRKPGNRKKASKGK
jgi:hypothetical protein